MNTSADTESQSFIQRWVLVIVGAFFVISLAAYLSKFHGPLSSSQDTWGQFGDFMGGAINPIVGLCTVWLLTVSLRQNQLALRQAHAELILATRALEESSEMQGKTESALKEQIRIADQTRDMANASALAVRFHEKSTDLDRKAKKEEQIPRKTGGMLPARDAYYKYAQLAANLDKILEVEAERLLKRYPMQNK